MGDLKKENNRKSAQWMANFANKKKNNKNKCLCRQKAIYNIQIVIYENRGMNLWTIKKGLQPENLKAPHICDD